VFVLECDDWVPASGSWLQYSFGYQHGDVAEGEETALTDVLNTGSASVILPKGELTLVAYVSDSVGAQSRFVFPVPVVVSAIAVGQGGDSGQGSDTAAVTAEVGVCFVLNQTVTVLRQLEVIGEAGQVLQVVALLIPLLADASPAISAQAHCEGVDLGQTTWAEVKVSLWEAFLDALERLTTAAYVSDTLAAHLADVLLHLLAADNDRSTLAVSLRIVEAVLERA
jgi:hypothetical protein